MFARAEGQNTTKTMFKEKGTKWLCLKLQFQSTTLDMTKFSVYAFNHSYAPDLTLISKDGCTHSPPPHTHTRII